MSRFVQMALAPRTRVLGIEIDALRADDLLERLALIAGDQRSELVCYVNAECLNQAVFDRRYRAILREAKLVYADGFGVVWASRLTSHPLPERITLGDVLPDLCRAAEERRWRIFILAGTAGVARRAATRLKKQFPHLEIVGTHHGFLAPEEASEVIQQINKANPHILFVGMGVPKQEKWLWQYRSQLQVPVLWGVGALFDYYAGKVPMAPRWMRRAGLEWFFRLLTEPRRLWRRYLLGNVFFLLRVCALLLIDGLLVAAAWLGAYWLRYSLNEIVAMPINVIEPYLKATPIMVGIWLVTCAVFGLYQRSWSMSVVAELVQVLKATWLGLLITMAAAFLFKELDFGRSVVLPTGLLLFILLSSSRVVVRAVERHLAKRGIGLRRTLIVGTGPLAKRLREEIETWPTGYEVVGHVGDGNGETVGDGDPTGQVPQGQLLGSLDELDQLIHDLDIQDVFVASHNLRLHQKLNLLAKEGGWPVNFHVVSEELEPLAQRVPLGRVVELPLLHLPPGLPGTWYEWTKRAFDLAVSLTGLLLCAPVLAVIAAAIKRESPGPAIFTQQRVGRKDRLFQMYKFRTMRQDADPYAVAPNDLEDPRVTRLGRFFRRWSLDELPQLVNVLKGDMSLVGPRPEMPFLVEQYEPWQKRRLTVRPGLTGLWQVIGRKELPLHRNIEYDLYYVRHRGWLLDLAILLRTLPAVILRRGAF